MCGRHWLEGGTRKFSEVLGMVLYFNSSSLTGESIYKNLLNHILKIFALGSVLFWMKHSVNKMSLRDWKCKWQRKAIWICISTTTTKTILPKILQSYNKSVRKRQLNKSMGTWLEWACLLRISKCPININSTQHHWH